MLCSLHVKNFAIIEDISIDFQSGMTVLTGETGAGKSLIIDATHLLLGSRLSTKVVRVGATKAVIEGIFEGYNENVKQLLAEYGIDELDDEELIIRREINDASKSTARINGMIVTLNQLEKIGNNLIDIHTQNDTKKLFDAHNYLDFIDNEECQSKLHQYQYKRKAYLDILNEFNNLEKTIFTSNEQLDYWKYQHQELESAQLNINEENELNEELAYLNNFENISNYLNDIKNEYVEHNINDSLYNILNYLKKLSSYNSQYQDYAARIETIYYDNLDIEETINNHLSSLDFDNERFDQINERLQYINDLKRKYRLEVSELIKLKETLEKRIKMSDDYDLIVQETKDKLKKAFDEVVIAGTELSNLRKKQADILKHEVMKTLKDLMLERVNFEITFKPVNLQDMFNEAAFKTNGVDHIDFLISFNPGQPLEPLAKVASGGEMSRIMLALKVYLTKELKLSTLIFDEIDSGISRNVAFVVGQKMRQISKNSQVFSITHLPIVASFADQHLFIEKGITENDMTTVNVKQLTKDERINELAIMLSPNSNDMDAIQKIAQEMIEKNSQN